MSKPPTRPRYHSILPGNGPPLIGKDILVFCDGTGIDGRIKNSEKEPLTNIFRLYQLALSPETAISGGRQKEIVYISGVGSGSITNPKNILSRLFGTSIVKNIVAAYLHIVKHYKPGDGIHLFGYSRGAFVARKVASLIYRIGIVPTEEELLKLWSQHERPVPWNLLNSEPKGAAIPIKSLVVWDTVGAIQTLPIQKKMELDILGMPDEELPPNVKHAFHVVAFHENRKLFRVTLFDPKSCEDSERLKEVWFPGAHSDVGGGSDKIDLPNISLLWVLGELQATCSLTVPDKPDIQLDYPELDKLTPSDAYHESPSWKRMVDKCETRISLLKPTSFIHETVLFLRNLKLATFNPLSNPAPYMLTPNDLMKVGWDIKSYVVAFNTFEALKRTSASAKRLGEHCRSRIMSISLSRPPSVAAQILTVSPSATPSPVPRIRSRAESHFIPRPPSEQAALRPAPTVAPQGSQNEAASGTTASRPPSASPHPAALERPTSTRPRAESHAVLLTRPTSPKPASDSAPIAAPRPRKIAVSSTILGSSRPGPPITPHLQPNVKAAGTRLRTESLAGPRLPTIPSRQAVNHSTLLEVPQFDRNAMSPADVSPRSEVSDPTAHIRTSSTRSRMEPRAASRLHGTSPVEGVPGPGTGLRLPTIPSRQAVHHSSPTEASQHLSPASVTSRSDSAEPRSPTAHVRTFSTRSRTESHTSLSIHSPSPVEAVPFPSASPCPSIISLGPVIHHPTPMEAPQHAIPAISLVGVTSHSDLAVPRSPMAHVRTFSTRSRAESHTSPSLHSLSPVEAVPFPSVSPRPSIVHPGPAIHHPTPMEAPQHGRNVVSPMGVSPRSDFAEPRSPATHVRTFSTRSRTKSHAASRPHGIPPVEAIPVPPLMSTGVAVPRHASGAPSSDQYISSGVCYRGYRYNSIQFKDPAGTARSWPHERELALV